MAYFGTIGDDGSVRRAGRRPLPSEEKLSAPQFVRFTPPGLQEIAQAAAREGKTAAAFTREAALERAREINGRGDE